MELRTYTTRSLLTSNFIETMVYKAAASGRTAFFFQEVLLGILPFPDA
jgi:hypothetical protein